MSFRKDKATGVWIGEGKDEGKTYSGSASGLRVHSKVAELRGEAREKGGTVKYESSTGIATTTYPETIKTTTYIDDPVAQQSRPVSPYEKGLEPQQQTTYIQDPVAQQTRPVSPYEAQGMIDARKKDLTIGKSEDVLARQTWAGQEYGALKQKESDIKSRYYKEEKIYPTQTMGAIAIGSGLGGGLLTVQKDVIPNTSVMPMSQTVLKPTINIPLIPYAESVSLSRDVEETQLAKEKEAFITKWHPVDTSGITKEPKELTIPKDTSTKDMFELSEKGIPATGAFGKVITPFFKESSYNKAGELLAEYQTKKSLVSGTTVTDRARTKSDELIYGKLAEQYDIAGTKGYAGDVITVGSMALGVGAIGQVLPKLAKTSIPFIGRTAKFAVSKGGIRTLGTAYVGGEGLNLGVAGYQISKGQADEGIARIEGTGRRAVGFGLGAKWLTATAGQPLTALARTAKVKAQPIVDAFKMKTPTPEQPFLKAEGITIITKSTTGRYGKIPKTTKDPFEYANYLESKGELEFGYVKGLKSSEGKKLWGVKGEITKSGKPIKDYINIDTRTPETRFEALLRGGSSRERLPQWKFPKGTPKKVIAEEVAYWKSKGIKGKDISTRIPTEREVLQHELLHREFPEFTEAGITSMERTPFKFTMKGKTPESELVMKPFYKSGQRTLTGGLAEPKAPEVYYGWTSGLKGKVISEGITFKGSRPTYIESKPIIRKAQSFDPFTGQPTKGTGNVVIKNINVHGPRGSPINYPDKVGGLRGFDFVKNIELTGRISKLKPKYFYAVDKTTGKYVSFPDRPSDVFAPFEGMSKVKIGSKWRPISEFSGIIQTKTKLSQADLARRNVIRQIQDSVSYSGDTIKQTGLTDFIKQPQTQQQKNWLAQLEKNIAKSNEPIIKPPKTTSSAGGKTELILEPPKKSGTKHEPFSEWTSPVIKEGKVIGTAKLMSVQPEYTYQPSSKTISKALTAGGGLPSQKLNIPSNILTSPSPALLTKHISPKSVYTKVEQPQLLRPKEITTQRGEVLLKPTTEPVVVTKMRQSIVPVQSLRPVTTTKIVQDVVTDQLIAEDYIMRTPRTTTTFAPQQAPPFIPTTPPIPLFGLPSLIYPRDKKKGKVKKVKAKRGYTPSVEAILFNIKGKKPPAMQFRSGLTMRPL